MIAQPALTIQTAAKPQTAQSQAQPANTNGFLTLLSATDAGLSALAQSTAALPTAAGASTTGAKLAKPGDAATSTPYVAASVAASANPATAGSAGGNPHQAAANAGASPANAVQPAAMAGQDAAAQAATGTGTSTAFGADQLNARIALGAPIYASQPNATMATVPVHLLDAPVVHAQADIAAAKPGEDAAPKVDAETNEPLPASANAAGAALPSLAQHASASELSGAALGPNDNSPAPSAAAGADGGVAIATDAGNSAAANAALAQQPNSATAPTAPAQLDAAVHTAAPYVPVGEQVALNLKQALTADNNEIRIQLKPASLGTIDVKLNLTQDGRVSAVISADRSDTLNMLKQDSGTLQQGLRDAGLNADGNSLSFNLRGDAQSFAQGWSQGGSGTGGGQGYGSGSTGNTLLGAEAATPTQRYHAGALDIEV